MFDLQLSIPELAIRAVVVYAVLLLAMRLSGKRTMGQFTTFDLVVVLLVSEAAGPAMVGGDESLLGGLLVALSMLALNAVVGYVTSHSRKVEKVLEGEACLLGRDGTIFESARKKYRIPQNEIDQALHQADCDVQDMRYAFLEADGTISIMKKKNASPD